MIMPQAPELSVYAARRLAAAGRYVLPGQSRRI